MSEIHSALAENFSITQGGPMHRLLVRLGNAGNERQRVVRRALAIAVITWLPLLILSLIQGQAYGKHIAIPFLRDYAANVRLLLAVPILILAESAVDRRWRITVLRICQDRIGDCQRTSGFRGGHRKDHAAAGSHRPRGDYGRSSIPAAHHHQNRTSYEQCLQLAPYGDKEK